MGLSDQLHRAHVEERLLNAVSQAVDAEQKGLPIQNGKMKHIDSAKNTDYEFKFGGDDQPEVYIYVRRLAGQTGVQLMLWADKSWFGNTDDESGEPTLAHAGSQLNKFGREVRELANEAIPSGRFAEFEYHQHAYPSIIFSSTVYFSGE